MAKEAKEAQGAKEAEGTIRCQLSAVSYHLWAISRQLSAFSQ